MIVNRYISASILISISIILGYSQEVKLDAVCAGAIDSYGVSGLPGSEFYWFIEGGDIISGDGTDTIEVQWGYNTGEFSLRVEEVTVNECEGVPSEATVQVKAPNIDLGPFYQGVCEGDTGEIEAVVDYDLPFVIDWHDGSSRSDYQTIQSEVIWAKATGSDGCSRSDTIEFSIYPMPEVNLGGDTLLCDEQNPLFVDVGAVDIAHYTWTTSQGEFNQNSIFIYPNLVIDTVRVKVESIYGCQMSDTMLVLPCDVAQMFADMYNTLTPNDDGDNDEWNIPETQFFPQAVLEVFDRWGRLVYRTERVFDEPWDGKSNGKPLPTDSYYFVLELNFMNIEPIVGTVNLIR